MIRQRLPLALGLAALGWSATAEAVSPPSLVPVTGYLTDDQGNPIDDTVEIRARLYTTATGGTAEFDENIEVDVDLGQFTLYLGDTKTLNLGLFQQNPTLFLGISVDGAAEMAPRFELGSAPFAANAQYCENANFLEGLSASDFRLNAQTVDWSELSGIPGDLADGDANTTYGAGTGLSLVGTTFSANQAQIEAWAKVAAYDTSGELITALGDRLLPDVSCNAGGCNPVHPQEEWLLRTSSGQWED